MQAAAFRRPGPGDPAGMTTQQFHRISKALADPRRYQILARIAATSELACSDVRGNLPISAPTLSHHVKELLNAGLIEIRREGQFMHMRLRRKVWLEYLARLKKL
jgi:ArsR family transcriptional regulator